MSCELAQGKMIERVIREGLSDEVTFKQRLKDISHLGIKGKSIPGKKTGVKTLETAVSLICLNNIVRPV